ncbi:MAG TPA: glycosyl hydrolase, partial [Burkholderiales bacterium]|nr:glycosyl hydrolase [Burkholderiales bacterium]
GGRRLHYVRADAAALRTVALDGGSRSMAPLPPIGIDFVELIAQSPVDEDAFAIATLLNKVFLTADGGSNWKQIAGRTQ